MSLFSNASMILLLLLKILCTSHYIKGGIAIIVRGHYKDTKARYDIEMLFIIIERIISDLCPLLRWRPSVGEPHNLVPEGT